jgi:hypothetical protein
VVKKLEKEPINSSEETIWRRGPQRQRKGRVVILASDALYSAKFCFKQQEHLPYQLCNYCSDSRKLPIRKEYTGTQALKLPNRGRTRVSVAVRHVLGDGITPCTECLSAGSVRVILARERRTCRNTLLCAEYYGALNSSPSHCYSPAAEH